ncbi:hypothetical protein KAR91_11255 [Candidatus Pacearchaeota archaeon]|nr:hypothetical protein [Candidatus Pacearchaeota archaeon]
MVSIIIPSLRKNQIKECISQIVKTTHDVEYEIIVVSPFPFHQITKWVEDTKIEGVNRAVQKGLEVAEGEYITTLSDEDRLTDNYLKTMLNHVAPHKGELFIGNPVLFGGVSVGDRPAIGYFDLMFAPFPFLHRDTIEVLGGLYDPTFTSFFADPDLSLRCWAMGGEVSRCPEARLCHRHIKDDIHMNAYNKNFKKDESTFIKRWGHLGRYQGAEKIRG